ncbi:DUF4377 domain-containing protein [Aquimarina sp. 2-A2]|uniref:DUF4377 domain-containing protein n=1 Tax=Aquimarina sp. 2-A2 TaxID=3382644 RepID=UPI00387F2A12
MKKLISVVLLTLFFASCKETKRILIADHLVDCTGVGSQQCMLIKENPDDDWTLFYDKIEGFEFEEGFSYEIEVEVTAIDNPPADGSSLRYRLSKVLSKTKTIKPKNLSVQQPITIEYEATSRGFYLAAIITQETITTSHDRNRKETDSKPCSKQAWEKVQSLLNTIKIKEIHTLEAPTGKRLFDGAAHAQLKISTEDSIYTSTSFDHGEPPKQIEPLVKHILSLAESVEKE